MGKRGDAGAAQRPPGPGGRQRAGVVVDHDRLALVDPPPPCGLLQRRVVRHEPHGRTRAGFHQQHRPHRSLPLADTGVAGLRFHDLRHTAATLAAASGTSLKALMTRIGHNSPAAALRYQHVIDGQDADIVKYLERFGDERDDPADGH